MRNLHEPTIAVVLPVWNEARQIAATIEHLIHCRFDEILVVDGASTDETYALVQKYGVRVRLLKTGHASRADQMNLGAFETRCEGIVFAHADMRFPDGAVTAIRQALMSGAVGGGFCKRYEPSNWLLNLYSLCLNNIYLRGLRHLVGTNAIFVRRDVFGALQGFPRSAFCEDLLFSDALKQKGPVTVLPHVVRVSSRRYQARGILRQILINARIWVMCQVFKVNPNELLASYRFVEKTDNVHTSKEKSHYANS